MFRNRLFILLLAVPALWFSACGRQDAGEFAPNTGQIQVLNGSGAAGMAENFRNQLIDHGFDVIEFGNARSWNYEHTLVIARTPSDRIARDVARVLGVDRVLHLEHPASLVEATVIIGKDHKEIMRTWPQPARN